MELELDRIQLGGFDALLDTTLFQEETLEMIVPDACPDILRIVDTAGKVLLRSRETMDGRAELAGTIRAEVVYIPDGESGVRHLDVTIPFTCAAEAPGIAPGCTVVAKACLRKADTRMINPRKVLVRAEAAAQVTVFAPAQQDYCCQVRPAGEDGGVEQLTETREAYLTANVQEKPFTVDEDITLSASKPAAVELLGSRVNLCCGESKLIGSKLIFKGSADVTFRYCGEDGGVYCASGEVPFSQIMEVSGVGEGADCDITLALIGCECSLTPGGEGREISVSLDILAQAAVRESRRLEFVADAYSTAEPLEARWEKRTLERRLDSGVRSQNVRETWESVPAARDVVDCRMTVGQVAQSWEGERLVLTAQTEVTVLYTGEDGELAVTQRQISVPCALEAPQGSRCFCDCVGVGEVYATAAAGGVEIRFALDFRYCVLRSDEIVVLTDLVPGEAEEQEGRQPSLVLRMPQEGERLWDVAKAYGTTIAEIIKANELTEDVPSGRLLLIPRKR